MAVVSSREGPELKETPSMVWVAERIPYEPQEFGPSGVLGARVELVPIRSGASPPLLGARGA
eukprot:5698153-Heterocapsa_arctica.AAC.1